jgi:amino acid permease
MYLLGLGGYLCFGSNTQGNILLNLSQEKSSPLIFLGRIGCGITIVLALAMMTLPCRRNVLELLDCWIEYQTSRSRVDAETVLGEEHHHDTVSGGEARRLLPVDFRQQHSLDERVHLAKNPMAHYGSTFLIILGCYLGAVAAPGVAIVWNLCGSFMAYLIGFILPTACYLELQRKVAVFPPGKNFIWRIISWILLLLSIVAAVACTSETAVTLFHEGVR